MANRTKGPERLSVSPTIPMTPGMLDRLRKAASDQGVAVAELVRRILAKALAS